MRIGGNVSGNGSILHREFAMASGEMGDPEYSAVLRWHIESHATAPTVLSTTAASTGGTSET